MASSLSSVTMDGVDKILTFPSPSSAFNMAANPFLLVESNDPPPIVAPAPIAPAMADKSPLAPANSAGIIPLKLIRPTPLLPRESH